MDLDESKLSIEKRVGIMPHITVKLWPGRSEEKKRNLAEKIAKDVSEELQVDIGHVSVSFEEVSREDWENEVYNKDILNNNNLYFKPAYNYD